MAQKLSSSLRRLLFLKNMHVSQLARETEIPQQTLSRLILAQTCRPHKKTVKRLAAYFKLSFEDLISFGEKETSIKTIPILTIAEIDMWMNSDLDISKRIDVAITNSNISSKSFAIKIIDSSMEPVFFIGAIALFDPEILPKNNSFVLAWLSDSNTYIFRQLVTANENQFIRPLNPELAKFLIMKLTKNDIILATLFEIQHKFIPEVIV